MEYLGHIVSKRGVEPVSTKVEAIQHWPTLQSVRALRGLLGLSGFYRCYIKGYATLTAPLTTLLTNDQFQWTPAADHAFSKLKEALCQGTGLGVTGLLLTLCRGDKCIRGGHGSNIITTESSYCIL